MTVKEREAFQATHLPHYNGHGSPAARCAENAMVVSPAKYPPGRVVWDARGEFADTLWDPPHPPKLVVVAVETCEHYPHAGRATVAFQMIEWVGSGRRIGGVRVWLIGDDEARIVAESLSEHHYRTEGAHAAMQHIVALYKRRRTYSAMSASEAFFVKNVLPSVEACLPSWEGR